MRRLLITVLMIALLCIACGCRERQHETELNTTTTSGTPTVVDETSEGAPFDSGSFLPFDGEERELPPDDLTGIVHNAAVQQEQEAQAEAEVNGHVTQEPRFPEKEPQRENGELPGDAIG